MVGDARDDLGSARAAKMRFVLLQNDENEAVAKEADAVVHRLGDLVKVITQWTSSVEQGHRSMG